MNTPEELKKIVKEKYGEIAEQSNKEKGCGCGCSPSDDYTVFSEDYSKLEGYNPDADLQLGCGLPTQYAMINAGDTVIDLGSGAGNDCFIARALAGEDGKVIGLDFTEEMVLKARNNASSLGFSNVEFVLGEIENIPIPENTADVVVSNCVMNLVPDKSKAFSETYRIMKPGGHFSISDIVLQGDLPTGLKNEAALYAGCVSGAVQKDEYLEIVKNAGFSNLVIQKHKEIDLPKEIYLKYLSEKDYKQFKAYGRGIFSITLNADKKA